MKYRVQYTKNKIEGSWLGMNKYASEELGVKFKHKQPAKTIVVYKKQPKRLRVATIVHEKAEAYLMKNHNMRYKRAHRIALKYEKKHKRFNPKTLIEMKGGM